MVKKSTGALALGGEPTGGEKGMTVGNRALTRMRELFPAMTERVLMQGGVVSRKYRELGLYDIFDPASMALDLVRLGETAKKSILTATCHIHRVAGTIELGSFSIRPAFYAMATGEETQPHTRCLCRSPIREEGFIDFDAGIFAWLTSGEDLCDEDRVLLTSRKGRAFLAIGSDTGATGNSSLVWAGRELKSVLQRQLQTLGLRQEAKLKPA